MWALAVTRAEGTRSRNKESQRLSELEFPGDQTWGGVCSHDLLGECPEKESEGHGLCIGGD